jgi:hypothetical protein
MEEIKVTIAVPTAGMVRMGFAYSLAGLVARAAAKGMPTRPEASVEIRMDVVESSVIHTNREKLASRAIESGQTHLMFFDDDMVFDPNILEIMLGRRQPIIVTNYLIKTAEPDFVAVGLNHIRVPTTEASTGMEEIIYSGFGASLFEIEVFKKTPQPWFQPKFDPKENGYTTEDLPFFEKARESGFKVLLDHDASKLVGHVGNKAWRWTEWKPKIKKQES